MPPVSRQASQDEGKDSGRATQCIVPPQLPPDLRGFRPPSTPFCKTISIQCLASYLHGCWSRNRIGTMRMRRQLIVGILGVSAISLGACANHTYAPGPGMSAASFGPKSARCKLFAEGTRPNTSFEAYGSPRTVAVESGAALLLGGIATAVHDSETYDNCMQAQGWVVTDNATAGTNAARPIAMTGVVQQPVTQSPLPMPSAIPTVTAPPPVVDIALPSVVDERTERAARAKRTAEAWLEAQNVLNGPVSAKQHSLYTALCSSGDLSACFMAGAR